MILEKEINELFELSKKAIESGLYVCFEISGYGYLCKVWLKETPESEMIIYRIYQGKELIEDSMKEYEAAKEHLNRVLEEAKNEKA